MRSLRRLIATGLLVLMVAVAGVVVWVIGFLDLNDYKTNIRQLAQQQLGIDLVLKGDIGHRLDLASLTLSAQGLGIASNGHPVADVERLELRLALPPLLHGGIVIETISGRADSLDLSWDVDDVFNLVPALTADSSDSAGQERAAMPAWLSTLRIDRIEASIGDGRYRDQSLGVDLYLNEALVDIITLPIIDDGRLVADTPALFGAYRNRWAVSAERLRLGALAGQGVDAVFENDHGTLSLSRLRARRFEVSGSSGGSKQTGSGLRLDQADIGGRMELDWGVSSGGLQAADWQALQRLDLIEATLGAARMRVGYGEHALRLSSLRASTSRLSLVPGLRAAVGSNKAAAHLSGLLPGRLDMRGRTLESSGIRLDDYALSIAAGKTLTLELAKGRLRIAADGPEIQQPLLSAQLSGTAELVLWLGSTLSSMPRLQTLDLSALQLQATDTQLGATGDRYLIATLEIEAGGLLLMRGGELLTLAATDTAMALAGSWLRVNAEHIAHERDTDHIDAVSVRAEGRGKSLAVTAFKAVFDDTSLTGSGEVALGSEHPAWRLLLDSSGVAIHELADLTDMQLVPVGRLAVALDLRGQGFGSRQLLHTLDGRLVIASDGLDLQGLDLDKLLTHLQYTQKGDLLDISMFLLTGPAGSLLLAATDFRSVLKTAGANGNSPILAMHSEVGIRDGVLRVDEAALSTRNHRFAIQGSVSLFDDGPVDLTVATVDSDGCPLFRERITGTLAEPDISHGGVLAKTLVQPVKTLVRGLLPGKRCLKPFYSGAVPVPPPPDEEPMK